VLLVSDPISPDHYQWHPYIECIEVTERMNFNLGNCIKYIWRHKEKGKPLVDLYKARWYLDREIELLQEGTPSDPEDLRAREAEWGRVEGECDETQQDEDGGSDEQVA